MNLREKRVGTSTGKRERDKQWLIFPCFLVLGFSSTVWIQQKKKKKLELFPSENLLYFCDGSGRIHQLSSTRENCQTLFRGVQHALHIRDDPRNVGGDERFLQESAFRHVHIRKDERRTLMFNTVDAL